MEAIITENQMELFVNFQIMENRKNEFQEKYNKLDDKQKKLFEELSRIFIPDYDGVLNEQKWYNTLGDVVGIFDPTGIVDLVNGISYITQGDWFFGLLSMISAVPYVGDAVAKPIMLAGKGGRLVKDTNAALKLAKAGKTVEATKIISDAAKSDSLMGKLLGAVRRWAPKLKNMVDKIPGGKLSSGLRNTIKDWISLFEKAGLGTQKAASIARRAIKNPMTREETVNVLKQMQKAVKQDSRLFRDFGGTAAKGLQGFKNYKASGMGRLFGNKATRSLMRRTKFWAGFLDWLGIANFVGPDDLKAKMPDFDEKMNQYSQTQEAKQNWDSDFANVPDEPTAGTEQQPETNGNKEQSSDFGKDLLTKLVFGPITGNVVA